MGLFNTATPKDTPSTTLKFRYMTPPHERDFSTITKVAKKVAKKAAKKVVAKKKKAKR